MKLSIEGTRFLQNDEPTYTRRVGFGAANEEIKGLLLGVAGELELAEIDSLEDTTATLTLWREHGAIAYGLDIGMTAETRLDGDGLARLRAVLDAGADLDMVPMLCFPSELAQAELLGAVWELLIVRLLEWGHDRVIFLAPKMPMGEQIAVMDQARDAVALHNTVWGHQMVLHFGAALPDGVESGDEPSELTTWLSRADLVWLDLAKDNDSERVTRWAQRTRAARRPLLVIGAGDVEGLATVRREQVSWLAPLDGGHDWLDATVSVTGRPAAPRSVKRFQHRIKSGHGTVVRRQNKGWR